MLERHYPFLITFVVTTAIGFEIWFCFFARIAVPPAM
jgi:hypothetical protein